MAEKKITETLGQWLKKIVEQVFNSATPSYIPPPPKMSFELVPIKLPPAVLQQISADIAFFKMFCMQLPGKCECPDCKRRRAAQWN
jgi:hypothetical protein